MSLKASKWLQCLEANGVLQSPMLTQQWGNSFYAIYRSSTKFAARSCPSSLGNIVGVQCEGLRELPWGVIQASRVSLKRDTQATKMVGWAKVGFQRGWKISPSILQTVVKNENEHRVCRIPCLLIVICVLRFELLRLLVSTNILLACFH